MERDDKGLFCPSPAYEHFSVLTFRLPLRLTLRLLGLSSRLRDCYVSCLTIKRTATRRLLGLFHYLSGDCRPTYLVDRLCSIGAFSLEL